MTALAPEAVRARAKELLGRWEHDPVLFATEVLRARLWSRQEEILRAVDAHDRVSVRSGHKIGKSVTAAILALWWVTTKPRARVAMTSATASQVRRILWRELQIWYQGARYPLGGKMNEVPASGLSFDDRREVFGFSTKEAERAAGISGDNVLFIVDEASGVAEKIFEALEGNRAGGAKIVMFSNPTQQSGTFFESHHTKRHLWCTISVSSEEAAEVTPRIPGLATKAWIKEKEEDWGRDSSMFAVRAKGEFAGQSPDSIVGLSSVLSAVARWEETPVGKERLECGLDAAREGDDDSELCLRRGRKEVARCTLPKGNGPTVATATREFIAEHRVGKEKPRVKVDVIGVGASVYDSLSQCDDLEVVPVNVSNSADPSMEERYSNLRAQLWFGMAEWLKDGGAIMPESKREGELVAPKYGYDARGRRLVEKKEAIKKRLKRSPDKAEALMLAIYTPPEDTEDEAPIAFK